ncbi:MAG: hypothetical protein NC548_58220 [Lachnospiraceae bacterium]|nr:hypothetical protein [Lachnospiraceae bacterium]
MITWPEVRIEFVCTSLEEGGAREERWLGEVKVRSRGRDTAELVIYGRDRCINAVIGKYMGGQYICIPDIDMGCPMGRLSDLSGNKERLSAHMDKAAAVTAAHALRALSGYTGKDWL